MKAIYRKLMEQHGCSIPFEILGGVKQKKTVRKPRKRRSRPKSRRNPKTKRSRQILNVDKYSSIDKSMSGKVQSKSKKTIKSIIELEKKYKKAQKSSNAKLIQDIDNLYGSLFGNNSSQERYDNFLNYYASDETFIATLVDILNPLVLNYKIIKL